MTNLAALRKERRMTTGALSERLSALGRPILANGITKIEKGTRRVDTDDLVALAVALDTTPNRLLLPGASNGELVELTASTRVSWEIAWKWADGDEPLPSGIVDDVSAEAHKAHLKRRERFAGEGRPHDPPEALLFSQLAENRELLRELASVAGRLLHSGISQKQIFDFLTTAYDSEAFESLFFGDLRESGTAESDTE